MIVARIPENENARIKDLHNSGLLDSPHEAEFDDIVTLASELCEMPISLISLVDSNRQWFKAEIGLGADETNREVSFCAHAILGEDLFEIKDTLDDVRFHDNPLVLENPAIRFYAGMPLVTSSGSKLGTLCVIDKTPRQLTDKQKFGLKVLANNVVKIAELRIKNKELYYHTESQKRIISILAHDVRNPLASIKNIIELKQSEILDATDASDMMNLVSGQLNNTIDMVENVVNWGKLYLQFGQFKYEEFDLFDLATHILDAEVLSSTAKNNKLINYVQKGTVIHSDKNVLEFIIRNLLTNATKFTENGVISVRAERMGMKTALWVSDTGVGMSEEQADKLLNINTFATTLGTKKEKGSGLGLILIKEFIERMDGSITVESKLNQGSCFKIII